MKRLPTALGAGVLSATVVISGLAFGVAPAQAAYVDPGKPVPGLPSLAGKLIFHAKQNDGSGAAFYAGMRVVDWPAPQKPTYGFPARQTLDQARAVASGMIFPKAGTSSTVTTPDGKYCYNMTSRLEDCTAASPKFSWGRVTGNFAGLSGLTLVRADGAMPGIEAPGYQAYYAATFDPYRAQVVVPEGIFGFAAVLRGQDDANRTATISGNAIPGSTVTRNGQSVTAGIDDGAWSMVVSGLSVGSNSLVFTEGDSGRQVTVPVTINSAPPVSPEIKVTFPSTRVGTTSDWGRIDVLTPDAQGIATVTAPTGTTFADARTTTGGGTISYNAARTVATITGLGNGGDNQHWGSSANALEFKLAVPASVQPGTVSGGNFRVARAAEFGGAVTVDKPFSVTVLPAAVVPPVSPEIKVTFPSTRVGETSDWARIDVLAPDKQGVATVTAPTGTTFADGRASGSGTTVTYNASRTVATITGSAGDNVHWGSANKYFEFKLAVPAATTPGSISGGKFTVARSPQNGGTVTVDKPFSVTVLPAAVVPPVSPEIKVTFPSTTVGSTSDWARLDVLAPDKQGNATVKAPTGTTFADARVSGNVGTITYNADRTIMTITGPGGADNVHWGSSNRYLEFKLAVPATVAPGTISGGNFRVARAAGDVQVDKPFSVSVLPAPSEPFTAGGNFNGNNVAHISGVATPGATVTLWEIDAPTRTTTATAQGTYDFAIPATRDGLRYFSAAQNVGGPNQSQIIPVPLNYGTVEQIHITAPGNGAQLKPEVTTFTGWGAPNAHVVLRDEANRVVLETDTDASGQWSALSASALTTGEHTYTATQTGFGGIVSSANIKVSVQPAVEPFTAAGAFDGNNLAHISGVATPGATVTLWELDAPTRTTVATPQGTYDFAVPATRDGLRYFTAAQNVGQSNQSAIIPVPLNYGTVAPVQITAPGNGAQVQPGVTTFTGRGSVGAHVVVRDESNAVVAETDVDATGAWSVPSTPLTTGQHTYTATQTGFGGVPSTAKIDVTVLPAVAPFTAQGRFDGNNLAHISGKATPGATVTLWEIDRPSRTTVATAQGTYDFEVPATRDGLRYFTAAQNAGQPNQSDIIPVPLNYGTVAPVQITAPGNGAQLAPEVTTFTGRGSVGAHVVLRDEANQVVLEADVDATGAWSRASTAALTPGQHTFTATQTGFGGVTSSANIQTTVKPASPFTAQGRFDGNNVAHIYGNVTPGAAVVIYEIDAPQVIIPGSQTQDGKYDYAVPATVGGVRFFTAAERIAGAPESQPVAVPLNYGTTVPVVMTVPDQANTGKVTLSGRGAPGADIVVKDGTTVVLTTTADGAGGWYTDTDAVIAPGNRVLTATQTSKGGVTTTDTKTLYVTPLTGQFQQTPDGAWHIVGNATPGAQVKLYELGRGMVDQTATAQGTYDFTLDGPFSGYRYFTPTETTPGHGESYPIALPKNFG